MSYLLGVSYFLLWYSSIVAGYILLVCPIYPILFINNELYRYLVDHILRFWELYPAALLHVMGTNFVITGDKIRHSDRAVIVTNHRTRTDWNFLWPIMHYATDRQAHSTKYVLKDPIKKVPAAGWVMMLSGYLFIKRRWEEDREAIRNYIQYISHLKKSYQILLFPEGTDFTVSTLASSNRFAEKNGLPNYEYVLHPRTTGFVFLVQQLQQNKHLDAVYDLTLAYSGHIPQNELDIVRGNFPNTVSCDIKRYSLDCPGSEEYLKNLITDLWKSKEEKLRQFETEQRFDSQVIKQDSKLYLFIPLLFWSLLPIVSIYFLILSCVLRYLALAHTAFVILVTFSSFENCFNFEIWLYNFKKKIINLFLCK